MVNYQHGPDDSVKQVKDDTVKPYDHDSTSYTDKELETKKRKENEDKEIQKKAKRDMIMALNTDQTPDNELLVNVLIYDLRNRYKKSDEFISDYWADFIQYRSDRFEKEGEYTNGWERWNLDQSVGTIRDKNGKKKISLRDLIISHFKAKYADELNTVVKTKGGKRRKTSRRTRKPRRKSSRRLRRKSRRQRKR